MAIADKLRELQTGEIEIVQTVYSDIKGGLNIIATPITRDVKCFKNTILLIDTISGLDITTVSE